ncbi:MAG: cytochrome c4 [Hydrocarboniphaga sp.]|uniref:c-type cytochrome n=1 Tax=Hydrocarboniphaga sp. TaxID=2033016 RepID=UPI00261C4203|nr:c-type cytochrome [Hydrocarboniphaga sp.]MDB5967951.1 cytochrome c4 [Hydrocarboniphaga sp.]
MKRMILFAAMLALGADVSAQPVPPALDSIQQRVLPCAACHGAEGRAARDGYYPRIAGKPAGYLYNQLLNFRDNRRVNAQMTYLVQRQSDDYLMEIARHFSGQDLPYPPPKPPRAAPTILERGMKLARLGDAAHGLPACQSCHGERLSGVAPAVPGLLGLPYDYIAAQLGSWREHIRRAQAPDCMAQIAERLSPEDVAAVAAWLAAQPMPADTHPATAFAAPPPLACGGLMPAVERAS